MMQGLLIAALLTATMATAFAADASVVDGGRFTLYGRLVALWGIAAPAAGEICTTSSGKRWACGDRARNQLRLAFAENTPDSQIKDTNVVQCRVAGLDIGLLLVKEGLAKSTGPYSQIEDRARAAKVGIWE